MANNNIENGVPKTQAVLDCQERAKWVLAYNEEFTEAGRKNMILDLYSKGVGKEEIAQMAISLASLEKEKDGKYHYTIRLANLASKAQSFANSLNYVKSIVDVFESEIRRSKRLKADFVKTSKNNAYRHLFRLLWKSQHEKAASNIVAMGEFIVSTKNKLFTNKVIGVDFMPMELVLFSNGKGGCGKSRLINSFKKALPDCVFNTVIFNGGDIETRNPSFSDVVYNMDVTKWSECSQPLKDVAEGEYTPRIKYVTTATERCRCAMILASNYRPTGHNERWYNLMEFIPRKYDEILRNYCEGLRLNDYEEAKSIQVLFNELDEKVLADIRSDLQNLEISKESTYDKFIYRIYDKWCKMLVDHAEDEANSSEPHYRNKVGKTDLEFLGIVPADIENYLNRSYTKKRYVVSLRKLCKLMDVDSSFLKPILDGTIPKFKGNNRGMDQKYDFTECFESLQRVLNFEGNPVVETIGIFKRLVGMADATDNEFLDWVNENSIVSSAHLIGLCNGKFGTDVITAPWEGVVQNIGDFARDIKENCVLMTMGYKDVGADPAPTSYPRREDSFTHQSVIMIDCDNNKGAPNADIIKEFQEEFKDYEYVLWETSSSTQTKPKFRAVFPLSEAIAWSKANKKAIQQLFAKYQDEAASWFYLPTIDKLGTFVRHEGVAFDAGCIKSLVANIELQEQVANAQRILHQELHPKSNDNDSDAHVENLKKKPNVSYYLSTPFNKMKGNGDSDSSLYKALSTARNSVRVTNEILNKARMEGWTESQLQHKLNCVRAN